jgi:hypothetical protein
VALGVRSFKQTLTNAYSQQPKTVQLERSAGATDITFGVMYFFPPLQYSISLYAVTELSYVMARAEANTFSMKTVKTGPTDSSFVYKNTQATYSKNKLGIGAGGGLTVEPFGGMVVQIQMLYKFNQMGEMPGEIRRLTGTFEEPSTTQFDFSMVVLSFGIGVRF